MPKPYSLSVYRDGEGQPVVFIHGFLSTHRYWNGVVAKLDKKTVQAVRPDLLGFGNSPKPKISYTFDAHIASLEDSINLDGQPAILVGHSMGAIIAIKWALKRPEYFSSLILTSITLLKPGTFHSQIASLTRIPFLSKNKLAKLTYKTMSLVSYLPSRLTRLALRHVPRHVAEDVPKHSPRMYRHTFKQTVFENEVKEDLAVLKVPTHIIVSSQDALVGQDIAKTLQQLAAANPLITYQIISADHNIPLQHPDLVAEAIMKVSV